MTISNKIRLAIPFLIIPIVTPLYLYLHVNVFANIFGCGCVPSERTNMLNIPFIANDLRLVVYALLVVLVTILSIVFSKSFEDKKRRTRYCVAAFITALFVSMFTLMFGVLK